MYKRNSVKKLGRTHSHRKALIQNQARSIVSFGKVRTTSVRAKVLKAEIESLIEKVHASKDGDITLLRELNEILGKKDLVKGMLELGKKEDIKVSIKKIGFRPGDNTEMSTVEIIGFKAKEVGKKKTTKKDQKGEEKKEEIKETKIDGEKKKSIINLGKKDVTKKAEPIKKERARTRSGL